MILKIQQTAFEREKNSGDQIYLHKMTHNLLDYKMDGLVKGFIIPDDLIAELEYYIRRNSLNKFVIREECKSKIHECCPRCLKAHMLKTAEKMGISEGGRQFLSLFVGGEAGHDGYYLDNDELIKV